MAQTRKKRRVANSAPEVEETAASSDSMEVDERKSSTEILSERIARKTELTKELISELDDLESSESPSAKALADVSITLLKLKSLQRVVLNEVRKSREILRKQGLKRDQQELQLENLKYQQSMYHTSQQQSEAASDRASAEIARLVRSVEVENGETKEDEEECVRTFLGADFKDPSQRSIIVAKLNREVATRKDLESTLKDLKKEQESKAAELKSRKTILLDLPNKLNDLEKASLPLQKFCQRQSNASVLMNVTPKLGTTKRTNRIDLAKSLPKALYTLFHQLQSSLDVMEIAAKHALSRESATPKNPMPTIEVENGKGNSMSSQVVVLKIPIPTISEGGGLDYNALKKQATISFEYDETSDLILATCGKQYDMGQVVIDELFPGDRGEYRSTTNGPDTTRRAYQWCNYLGGLRVAPKDQEAAKMHVSARVILKALVRRVRATATLSWILHSLSLKPKFTEFPKHNAVMCKEDHDARNIKLSSWTAYDTETSKEHVCVYKAVLQKGNSEEKLAMKVWIDHARYPSVAPRWKILTSSEDDREERSLESMPLYYEGLARLEQGVNRFMDRLVLSSNQATYDWILGQQLIEIARGWDSEASQQP